MKKTDWVAAGRHGVNLLAEPAPSVMTKQSANDVCAPSRARSTRARSTQARARWSQLRYGQSRAGGDDRMARPMLRLQPAGRRAAPVAQPHHAPSRRARNAASASKQRACAAKAWPKRKSVAEAGGVMALL